MNKNPEDLLTVFRNLFEVEFPLGFWTGEGPSPFDETWTFHATPEGEVVLRVVLDDGRDYAEFEWTLNPRSES